MFIVCLAVHQVQMPSSGEFYASIPYTVKGILFILIESCSCVRKLFIECIDLVWNISSFVLIIVVCVPVLIGVAIHLWPTSSVCRTLFKGLDFRLACKGREIPA